MTSGLLWFDDTPDLDLASKIDQAAQHYQRTFGQRPTLCFLHPSEAPQGVPLITGVKIQIDRQVPPRYLWLGTI